MTNWRALPALLIPLVIVASACTRNQEAGTSTTPSTTTTTAPVTTTTAPEVSGPEPEEPMFEPADCEFEVPANRVVECGWLEVRADRTDPEGGKVRLHTAVFKSDSPDPAPDPVVYLEGGPGGDSLEVLPLVFEDSFAHLLGDRDVIFFDQRGTGFSEPSLACPELRELGFEYIDRDDVTTEEFLRLELETIGECRTRLLNEGARLDTYTSANSAADLADLRRALDIEEWNVYGISYGTRLALTAMRDGPEGIRSVVIDSVYPPDVDIIAEGPPNLDRALGKLFGGCAADDLCSAAYPDLEATFYRLIQALEEEPIRAPVTDIFTGDVYDAVFNGASLGGVVFQSLYSADAIEILPQMIENVASGETYELSVLMSSFLANGEFISAGMQLSVQCYEEAGFTSPGAVADALLDYPRLETIFEPLANLGPPFFDVCATWGVGQAEPLENEPVTSVIPTLVLAGEYDPITPPGWAQQAASTLANSTYLEFPGLGYGPSASADCPKSILREFLNDPRQPVSTDCVAGMGPPEFITPDTPIPAVSLVPFTESLLGTSWSGLIPDGWDRQAPGVWARGLNGFDQTAIIQQFAPGTPPTLVLALIAPQFGLGEDPEPTESYRAPLGTWSLYEGSLAGTAVTIGLIEASGGTMLIALVSPPAEETALLEDVFFPALDAITTG